MEHYSQRLQRNYEDADMLLPVEAASVISANSGRTITARYVSDLVAQGRLEKHHMLGRVWYQYSDLKNFVVSTKRGRQGRADATERMLYMRQYAADQRRGVGPYGRAVQGRKGKTARPTDERCVG